MAKRSKIVRNEQRRHKVAKYAAWRARLKAITASPGSTLGELDAARRELSRQPRDASATRLRNRDAVDGRPRDYLRAFGVSRVRLRERAHGGYLPGARKGS